MYKTRFVMRLPLSDAGKVGTHVDEVCIESGTMPVAVHIVTDDETQDVIATINYMTNGVPDSDRVIGAWRGLMPKIQVERTHCLHPDQFESVALAGSNGRALRRALSRNVRELCVRGVGSKGVLEYLEECESIVSELKEFVQSTRAPV